MAVRLFYQFSLLIEAPQDRHRVFYYLGRRRQSAQASEGYAPPALVRRRFRPALVYAVGSALQDRPELSVICMVLTGSYILWSAVLGVAWLIGHVL